jgi:long-chain acyl-CoA synthetase
MIVNTLPKALFRSVEQNDSKTALMFKHQKQYISIDYQEMYRRVFQCARGLHALGVSAGDRVSILSDSCHEWAISDWAIIGLGAISVPIYPTLTAPQVWEILSDSQPKVLICRDDKQLKKALQALEGADFKPILITIQPDTKNGVLTFEELLNLPGDLDEAGFRQIALAIQPDDIATFIYTSGTTGEPKGAMLTHNNLVSNIDAVLQIIECKPNDMFLSFLPLSHVFERMGGHFLPVYAGLTIAYAESLFTLSSDMQAIKPTIMLGVPRFFSSVMDRIQASVREQSPVKQKIFHHALAVGKCVSKHWREGTHCPFFVKIQHAILDRLVGQKLRDRVGGNLRLFVSGGAALPVDVAEFFHAFDILILEGYGLTETSPVLTVNPLHAPRFGSVGKPIPGVQIKIAEDGEILASGPNIMKGYYQKPEATAACILNDWFYTGDIGHIDANGYLHITDRKKDLLVLANGKNVAPQPIENMLRASEYIQEAVLFGDGMSALVALIVVEMERVKAYAKQHEIDASDIPAMLENDQIYALFREQVEKVNRDLADYQRVRRFTLIPNAFSIETGELTPTLKVKRRVVAQKYASLIEKMGS